MDHSNVNLYIVWCLGSWLYSLGKYWIANLKRFFCFSSSFLPSHISIDELAPEILLGIRSGSFVEYDHSVDWYSLGVVACRMLTNQVRRILYITFNWFTTHKTDDFQGSVNTENRSTNNSSIHLFVWLFDFSEFLFVSRSNARLWELLWWPSTIFHQWNLYARIVIKLSERSHKIKHKLRKYSN